jgi:hypothetical protein
MVTGVIRVDAIRKSTETAAADLQDRIRRWLTGQASELRAAFGPVDGQRQVTVDSAVPDDGDRGQYWRGQIVRAAKTLDFFSNHKDGTWWCRLRVSVLAEHLRYLAVVQKVGHGETGVLALSLLAEFVEPPDPGDPESRPSFRQALIVSPGDSLTFTAGEDLDRRTPEIEEVLERTLALSLDALGQRLA